MADPNMTVPEALAWIISRDDAFSASCRSLTSLGFAAALAIHKHAGGALLRTLKAAEKALESKCRDGRITASGFRGNLTAVTARRRTSISQTEWIGLKFVDGHILGAKYGSDFWYHIMFSRSDVVDQYRPKPTLSQKGVIEPNSPPNSSQITTIMLKVKNSHQSKAFEASITESFPEGLPEGILLQTLKDQLSKTQAFKLRGLKLDKLRSGGYDASLKRMIGRAKS